MFWLKVVADGNNTYLLIHIHIIYHTVIVFRNGHSVHTSVHASTVRTYDFILEIKHLFGDKT